MSVATHLPEFPPGRGSITELGDNPLRTRLTETGVFAVRVLSSPGAGKTAFLETILSLLQLRYHVGLLVGMPITENERQRLASSKALVKEVLVPAGGQLEPDTILAVLEEWKLEDLDFLFVEETGSFSCPPDLGLGEHLRLTLMSATQGEDKPLKYPRAFQEADLVVVNKADLAEAVHLDWAALDRNIQTVRPGVDVIRLSTKTGVGVRQALTSLVSARNALDTAAGVRKSMARSAILHANQLNSEPS